MGVEQIAATVAYGFLVTGLLVRTRRDIHPWLMASGLFIDLILVIVLQIQRGVIQGAVTESYSMLQRGHILSSTIAFALYFPLVYFAVRQLLRIGDAKERLWHIRIGVTAFSFRSVGFVLMFTI